MTDSPRYSVSVAAAVVREDGKVLAIKRRDNGHWEPPGGVLESGEPIHEGLIREVQEETGLTVNPGPLTGVYQNLQRDILALVFRCEVGAGEPRKSDETAEVAWLTLEQVQSHMSEAYSIRLTDALRIEGATAIRQHDGVALSAHAERAPRDAATTTLD